MDRNSEGELSTPLLDPETGELPVIAEGRYNSEGGLGPDNSEGGSQPMPSWLSERQDPLQDSPATYQTLGMISNAEMPTQYDRPPVIPKHSRAKRTAAATARARRQAFIVLDEDGRRTYVHADKRAIIHSIGLNIPIRDMRLLDFNLGASDSTILVRDNAIIVSMEHVRFIVTADRVMIPREGTEQNPLTAQFVSILEDALVEWTRQRREFMAQQEREVAGMEAAAGGMAPLEMIKEQRGSVASDIDDASSVHHELQEPLPFELVVLEAALKEVLASLSLQIKELEGVALPALDALTRSVSSANLERVRKVKTRHQRLTLRAEALRDELQRFLQDDDDMSEMCLTRRKELEEAAKQALAAEQQGPSGGDIPPPRPPVPFNPGSLSRRSGMALARLHSSGAHSGSSPPHRATSALPSRDVLMSMTSMGGTPAAAGMAAAAAAAAEEDADAEAQQDVENLLESYYMQVDGLFDKLVSVGEYVKDTEEYINIELDSSRNRLIRFEVILTVASFAIMPFNLLAGILGENLIIPEQITGSVGQFYGVNIAATALCALIFYVLTLYMRYAKLI